MLDKRTKQIVLATFGTILLLILGNIVIDFKIFDMMYIFALIAYFIRYKFVKNS